MAGRKIRDERDARRCMAKADAAGGSRAEWARSHGIDGRSLYAWGKNLEKGDKTRARKKTVGRRKKHDGLVELVAGTSRAGGRYVIRRGEFAIEVDGHFDEETVVRLLTIVAAC